jgi:D-glycero-D-manno-heptose 1,7-bisphosphate phosphatase
LKPPVFLDRDGTLIVDRHYLSDPAGVELLPGAAEAVARLNGAGHPVFLVTNQSGIGRGYFTEAQYRAVHVRLVELLNEAGTRLDGEYHAPHAPADPDPEALRKPGAGMFLRAAREHGVELAGAFFVGDRLRDVAPAERFGGTAILVRGPQTEVAETPPHVQIVKSLAEAVERILALSPG